MAAIEPKGSSSSSSRSPVRSSRLSSPSVRPATGSPARDSARCSTNRTGRPWSSRRTECTHRDRRACCDPRGAGAIPYVGSAFGLEPGLDRAVLGVEMGEVWDEILDHRQMGQRIDRDALRRIVGVQGASERVGAANIHRARAAHAFAAGAAEGQRGVDIVFDPDECVEDHRPAIRHVHPIGVEPRVLGLVGIEAVDAVFAPAPSLRALGWWISGLALLDLGSCSAA